MLNCFYSLVFNVSAAGLYQENKTKTYSHYCHSLFTIHKCFQCFSSRSMTFTRFKYGASPWRHLALLLTALALTAPVSAVVTSWRERLARRCARP